MKLRALKKFIDAETGEKRKPGDIFEATESRGEALKADPRKMAEEVSEAKEPEETEEKPKPAKTKKTAKSRK